jgi:alpha-glucoside transport system substrate-binding protein
MKRNRWQLLLLLLVALAFALAACGGDDDDEEAGGDGDTTAEGGGATGGTVSILSLWGGAERDAFQKVLDGFTQETGIQTKYESARDFEPVIRTRLAAGNPPDMAIVPRPGVMVSLAQEGSLKSLEDLGIDESAVQESYSQAWIDLGTVDDQIYGIAAKANSKSVVWFNPATLQELGIEPPETWDDLLAATQEIQQGGGALKPWAVGAKDSWTLTDWFENIYARTAGPEMYEQLFSGELEFTDQSVKDAIAEMSKVLNEDTLPGGVQGALGTAFVDSIGQVFGTNPRAALYMEGGFVGGIALGDVNPELVAGETIDFVPFPTINEEHGSPLVGGGDLAVAFNDSDQTKQLMEYLMTKEAGETWAATGAIVSPNKSVEISTYPNELTQKEAEQVVNAEVFRFDGSDLLPGALANDWGALLQNAIRNPNQVDGLLEDFQSQAEGEFE